MLVCLGSVSLWVDCILIITSRFNDVERAKKRNRFHQKRQCCAGLLHHKRVWHCSGVPQCKDREAQWPIRLGCASLEVRNMARACPHRLAAWHGRGGWQLARLRRRQLGALLRRDERALVLALQRLRRRLRHGPQPEHGRAERFVARSPAVQGTGRERHAD